MSAGELEGPLLEALSGSPTEVRNELTGAALRRMETLDVELSRWASRVRLVGFRTRQERVRRYFAEPLAALPFLPAVGEALDVGSGGGSPALPLAIVRPRIRWTLMESRRKKSLVLSEIARSLGLENVAVVSGRFPTEAREWADLVTIRGVRMSEAVVGGIQGALRPGGRLLWFTGTDSFAAARAELVSCWRGEVSGPHRLLPGSVASVVVADRR